ncbi:hypothetical protein HW571_26385 [Agrobacterium genomosp. 3]|nr:hypothetical protein [Agrobacterium tomkonis]
MTYAVDHVFEDLDRHHPQRTIFLPWLFEKAIIFLRQHRQAPAVLLGQRFPEAALAVPLNPGVTTHAFSGAMAPPWRGFRKRRPHQSRQGLDPSLQTLMTASGRCKDAVWKALKALRQHGVIYWLRRYVPTGNDGAGPQVKQTSDAYRLVHPQQAEQAVREAAYPSPEDHLQDAQDKAAKRAA